MSKRTSAAFTFAELIIVVAVVIILWAILASSIQNSNHRAPRIACLSNLKQIGISFLTWSVDNTNRFPMEVPVSEGGTMGLASGRNAFVNFVVMSNELSIPKILVCPADEKRTYATNFFPDLNNSKISYFIGIDAVATNKHMILSGDRNITNGVASRNGLLALDSSHPAGWTDGLHKGGGNLLLSDGSAQMPRGSQLQQLISASGTGTNRLAIP